MKLSGIGQGTQLVTHKFHALPDDFPIQCDGIIGMDFVKQFNCKLDFIGLYYDHKVFHNTLRSRSEIPATTTR